MTAPWRDEDEPVDGYAEDYLGPPEPTWWCDHKAAALHRLDMEMNTHLETKGMNVPYVTGEWGQVAKAYNTPPARSFRRVRDYLEFTFVLLVFVSCVVMAGWAVVDVMPILAVLSGGGAVVTLYVLFHLVK